MTLLRISRSYHISSLLCRRFLLKFVNMEIPENICLVVNVLCCLDFKRQHRRFRTKTNLHWHHFTFFMIQYILFLTVLSVELLNVVKKQLTVVMELSSKMLKC